MVRLLCCRCRLHAEGAFVDDCGRAIFARTDPLPEAEPMSASGRSTGSRQRRCRVCPMQDMGQPSSLTAARPPSKQDECQAGAFQKCNTFQRIMRNVVDRTTICV